MKRLAVVVMAGLVACAGCTGGGSGKGTPTKSPGSSTTTIATRSVAETASVVAQQRARIEDLQGDLEDCPTTDETKQVACAFIVERAPTIASLVVEDLAPVMDAKTPDEVRTLLEQTVASAEKLHGVDVSGCEVTTFNEACNMATSVTSIAVDDLLSTMDGWAPYT